MLKAAVVGATGIVGQQFLLALDAHPWIEVTGLAASARSAGKRYAEALRDPSSGARRWYCPEEPPRWAENMIVEEASRLDPTRFDIIFTAIESDEAQTLEPMYARTTPVISTASAFRYEDDVPILIPGINTDHARLLHVQRRRRGWQGFIVPIPNCTTTGLAITLRPLADAFGIRRLILTSLQAISGAGRSPGVVGMDILDNVIPFIPKEEEKVEREARKILGRLEGEGIVPAAFALSATCTRVHVMDGHTEAVFVELERPATIEESIAAWSEFRGDVPVADLPSAPEVLIRVTRDPYRPQPRLDREAGNGMTTTVGRVRQDPVLTNGLKYVLVSHNTKMGAAKGAVFTAEMLIRDGYIGK